MLLIAAILLLIAVPSYQHLVINERVTTTLNQLDLAIQFARSEAIKRRDVVAVCGSADGHACDGRWSSGLLVLRANSGKRLHYFPGQAKHVQIVWRSSFAKNHQLTFVASGFTRGQQGSFYVCPDKTLNSSAQALVVAASGRLRLLHDPQKVAAICTLSGQLA